MALMLLAVWWVACIHKASLLPGEHKDEFLNPPKLRDCSYVRARDTPGITPGGDMLSKSWGGWQIGIAYAPSVMACRVPTPVLKVQVGSRSSLSTFCAVATLYLPK
jgi:hypothetical protein